MPLPCPEHWVTSRRKLALAEPWGPCLQNSFLFGWTDCKKALFWAMHSQARARFWWVHDGGSPGSFCRGPGGFTGPFQPGSVVKILLANAGNVRDAGSITGSGRSPGGGHSNPLHYSCLENHMDRGAWWATFHRVAKNQTRMKQHSMHECLSRLGFYFRVYPKVRVKWK